MLMLKHKDSHHTVVVLLGTTSAGDTESRWLWYKPQLIQLVRVVEESSFNNGHGLRLCHVALCHQVGKDLLAGNKYPGLKAWTISHHA